MPDMIAERLLRLVAPREEACTIAGDLHELAVRRGKVWFRFAIARTMLNLLWKDLTSEPLFLALLGVRGLLVTVCLGSLIGFIAIDPPFGVALKWEHGLILTAQHLNLTAFDAAWLTAIGLTQFITGLYLAKKSRGRQIPAVLAYVAVYNVLRAGMVVVPALLQSSENARSLWHIANALTAGMLGHGLLDQLALFMKFGPLFLGALLARFRQHQTLSNI